MTTTTPNPPPAKRVAYLLADAGIPYTNSKKGSSIHARSMVRAFEQEGCQVDVYVFRKGDRPIKGFKAQQVKTSALTRFWQRRLLEGGLWRRLWPLARKGAAPPNWMVAVSWLLWHRDFVRHVGKKARKGSAPDLIYARSAWLSFPYARLKKILGVPLFLEVNAVMSIEKAARGEMAFLGLTQRIEREMFLASDQILPVSAEIKEQIVQFGVEPQRVVVTPNAVDLELFSPAQNGEGPREGEFIIGAVNSFRAYHGMGTLVRAAALLKEQIPGLRLLLIGGGEQFELIKELARQLGLASTTEFTGIVDHHRVPELLRRCRLCAAPYEGDHNQYNCPMKLYEYMGMKIPVVAADWGDIPNIVAHGQTALLHKEGDPAALAEAILEVWRQPEAARQRAEAAYLVAQRHTWRATARAILDWQNDHSHK